MSIRTDKCCALALILLVAFTLNANAQFSSGSTGTDGALDYSSLPANSTVTFDPTKFNSSLHPPGQNVYNFTTINIPSGITVILSGQTLNGPVFWLTQGDVVINGALQLSGGSGNQFTTDASLRIPAVPGPGGYPGGIGGNSSSPAQPGYGPGGGAAGNNAAVINAVAGTFTGNSLLAPPIGGSGGGGVSCNGVTFGPGGGAGGGALVIASSTVITVNGTIDARGGHAGGPQGVCNFVAAGGGAGGSVELAANSISGSGTVMAAGGANGLNSVLGGSGLILFESVQLPISLNSDIGSSQSAPGALFQPNLPVSIQVVSVAGVQVANPALGRFQNPDVVINSSSPVTVTIQTTGIPPGTVLSLNIYSENGTAQTVQATPLQGTLQSATATANVTFPPDLSLGYVKATWKTQ